MKFRDLTASEVECRVATASEKGVSLLLYKDARCDMRILDETVGAEYWQRKHELINGNLFCSVGIYNKELQQWIWKQDVGTESYTEKEKGQSSDSFKRSCFCWGIGRELYTAPFIWVKAEMKQNNGRWTTYDKFDVSEMVVEDGTITKLQIVNSNTKKVVFTYGTAEKDKVTTQIPARYMDKLVSTLKDNEIELTTIYKLYKVSDLSELNLSSLNNIMEHIPNIMEWQAAHGN
ncbi:MAG: hypothetical protein KBT34_09985 [Prevotella sp.]|nr:hypothetical protein [Candidatus Prevotella equi]